MKQVKVTMVSTGDVIYRGILDDEETYCYGYDATYPKTIFNLPTSCFTGSVFKVDEDVVDDKVLELLVNYKDLKEEQQVLTADKLNLERNTLSKGSTSYAVILNLIADNKESIADIEEEFGIFAKECHKKREEMLAILKEGTNLETSVSKATSTVKIYGSMLPVTQRIKRLHYESCRTGFWQHDVKLEGDFEQVVAEVTLYCYLNSEFNMEDAKEYNITYKRLNKILIG